MADRPVAPGGVIGILGGGQLGRMLAGAAAELGLACHIYSPDPDSPAFQVTARHTLAGWDDAGAIDAFADAVDVVTYEFENVPFAAAERLRERVPVHPSPEVLAIAQDRIAEKMLMDELGVAVAPWGGVNALPEIYSALARSGRPAMLKARRLGYDGKGQALIRTGDDPVLAWRSIGEAPAILEGFIEFHKELSVLVARGRDGAMAVYDVTENRHRDRILAVSRVPAAIPPEIEVEAKETARRIAGALDYVGVLAVEMFLTRGERPRLLVNEIAPRVHNSFHWTQDGCLVSQFEQHIRAVAGWPLGDTRRHSDAEMTNLVGNAAADWAAIAADPAARLHLYGKSEARTGRKMGHVNRIRPKSGGAAPAPGAEAL